MSELASLDSLDRFITRIVRWPVAIPLAVLGVGIVVASVALAKQTPHVVLAALISGIGFSFAIPLLTAITKD